MSGDLLNFTNEGCTNSNGDLVLKFSGKFIETIKAQEASGYKLHGAKVNFILFWKKPDEEQEFKIILPELLFER
jgi:ATP-dependent DNA helicase RecQ